MDPDLALVEVGEELERVLVVPLDVQVEGHAGDALHVEFIVRVINSLENIMFIAFICTSNSLSVT